MRGRHTRRKEFPFKNGARIFQRSEEELCQFAQTLCSSLFPKVRALCIQKQTLTSEFFVRVTSAVHAMQGARPPYPGGTSTPPIAALLSSDHHHPDLGVGRRGLLERGSFEYRSRLSRETHQILEVQHDRTRKWKEFQKSSTV